MEIILWFLRLHPLSVFQTLLLTMRVNYSMASNVFLPTVVDTMVIWIEFAHFRPLIPLLLSPAWPHPIYLDSWTYAILFFTALYFPFTTRHTHNWVSFPLWPSCFILSGAISNCSPRFPSTYIGHLSTWGAHLLVSGCFAFYSVQGVLVARILEWVALSSSSGPHFVSTLHCDLFVLGGPAWYGS